MTNEATDFGDLDLEVDFQRLDKQISNQSRMMQVWTEREADAKLDEDIAKAKMEQVQSQVSLDVRKSPDKYGLDKITDKAVDALVTIDPKYKKAQDAYFSAVRYRSAVKGVVSSLHDRRSGLESMVRLHSQQWFAEVRLDAEGHQVVNQQAAKNPVGKVLRKKRKKRDAK